MSSFDPPLCFLFDNGSLRAAATLSLRDVAGRFAARLGSEVRPVSLLHSSGVAPRELNDEPAQLLEPALLQFARQGGRRAVLLPLFFGPSGALTEYLPARLASIKRQYPELHVAVAKWLVTTDDDSADLVAGMLARTVEATRLGQGLSRPKVLLTDHGSPQLGVTQVRNRLGVLLGERLGSAAEAVGVASMERRPEPAYDFNEPSLERALRQAPFDSGDVIVALQFLQAGRHAGPGGDIAQICRQAEAERPGLRTYLTEPLVRDPALLELLARRYAAAVKSAASAR